MSKGHVQSITITTEVRPALATAVPACRTDSSLVGGGVWVGWGWTGGERWERDSAAKAGRGEGLGVRRVGSEKVQGGESSAIISGAQPPRGRE